jgi:hypothetical protein
MDNERMKRIRMVLSKDQIMSFVGGLHSIQLDMIDEAVERSDMSQAKEVLAHIQSLPGKPLTK